MCVCVCVCCALCASENYTHRKHHAHSTAGLSVAHMLRCATGYLISGSYHQHSLAVRGGGSAHGRQIGLARARARSPVSDFTYGSSRACRASVCVLVSVSAGRKVITLALFCTDLIASSRARANTLHIFFGGRCPALVTLIAP